jgi:hypothetical protein
MMYDPSAPSGLSVVNRAREANTVVVEWKVTMYISTSYTNIRIISGN